MSHLPILWSFRRCPYAMRARMAVLSAGVAVELREILLRNKPAAFCEASPSATVPCLELNNRVLDESLDIMVWALEQSDPQGLLDMPDVGWALMSQNDGPFKSALDHTKYATRYPELDPKVEREKAMRFLIDLNARLSATGYLVGDRATLADYAIFPFVRQFANIDGAWFDAEPWPELKAWLLGFTESAQFEQVMEKYKPWSSADAPVLFGT